MVTFDLGGQIGIWTTIQQWPEDTGATAAAGAELEDLGFATVWVGGSSGQFPIIDRLLSGTTRLTAATGIIQIWANPAESVAAEHDRLNTKFPRRFLLGLGVGHAPLVEALGLTYIQPMAKLAGYLDELDTAEHPVPVSERVIAALRPRALTMTRDRAAGAHPYNVSPEHTAKAREILGPAALLLPEQKVFFTTDSVVARELGRKVMSGYLRLSNYLNNFRELGFDDADFADGGSDRFIDTMVAWGSAQTVAARIREHLDAGADQVAVQVLSPSGPRALPRDEWRAAAAALLN